MSGRVDSPYYSTELNALNLICHLVISNIINQLTFSAPLSTDPAANQHTVEDCAEPQPTFHQMYQKWQTPDAGHL